jgi:hypothetical protein
MNPIELFIIAGRIGGVVGALAVVGWVTSRRVAKHAPATDPIRSYLDQSTATQSKQRRTS